MRHLLNFNTSDIEASIGCFFDSFIKIILGVSIMITVINISDTVIYQKVLPSVGLSMLLLQIFTLFSAYSLAKSNPKVISLPSGIAAETFFVCLFAIMIPTYKITGDPALALATGVGANFISSLIMMLLSMVSNIILKYIPKQVLFASLAGATFTWLVLSPIKEAFNSPLFAMICFFIMLIPYIGNIKIKPSPIIISIIVGIIISLSSNDVKIDLIINSTKNSGFYLPSILFDNLLLGINEAIKFLPIIIPIAIIELVGAIQAVEQARNMNHNYNPKKMIFITSLISLLSTFIGNPFTFTIFWGYSAWVKINASKNYPILIAILFFITTTTYIGSLIVNIIPIYSVLPIIIFIGLISVSDSLRTNDPKYFEAMILIMCMPIFNFLYINMLDTSSQSIKFLAQGATLLSLVWGSIFIFIMDRKYFNTAISCIIAAILSALGLIHAKTILENPIFIALYLFMAILFFLMYYFNKKKIHH